MNIKPKQSKPPSNRERQLLVLIIKYQNENGQAPFPSDLVEEFGFNLNYVLTVIGRLENKRLAKRNNARIYATPNAESYFRINNKPIRTRSVIPTAVRVRGIVRAGKTSNSDLDVSLGDDIESPLTVPNTRLERNTYALKVVGDSMEHEHIFENDYVIVEELQGLEQPQVGEMIVAEYLPFDNENDDQYMGLTLKILKAREDKTQGIVYFLGWQKDNQQNPNPIPVKGLRNVRRVIGVYRNLRRKK